MSGHELKLTVDGAVRRPLALSLSELLALPVIERDVTLDCGKGTRTGSTMKGPALSGLIELAHAQDDAVLAIFHCTDGHRESVSIADLLLCDAFLACSTNEEHLVEESHAVRLVIPGKFGDRWAKFVNRIEIVADDGPEQP